MSKNELIYDNMLWQIE